MARKAVNVPDNSKARAQRGNVTSQQKPTKVSNATKTSGVTGRQPKAGGITIREGQGGNAPGKSPAKDQPNTDPKYRSVMKREDSGGYNSNAFTGKRGVAPQKSYPTTPLRDGTGAKGAKGK